MEELELAYDDLVWLAEPDDSREPSRSRKQTEGA